MWWLTIANVTPVFLLNIGLHVNRTTTSPMAVLSIFLGSRNPVFDSCFRVDVVAVNARSPTRLEAHPANKNGPSALGIANAANSSPTAIVPACFAFHIPDFRLVAHRVVLSQLP